MSNAMKLLKNKVSTSENIKLEFLKIKHETLNLKKEELDVRKDTLGLLRNINRTLSSLRDDIAGQHLIAEDEETCN